MLDAERFARAIRIFHEASGLPRTEWAEFVQRRSPDDAGVRSEALAMLITRRDTGDDTFLDDARAAVDAAAAGALRERPPSAPTAIGPYDIVRLLGAGGMGEVYLAQQRTPVRRQVALKLLGPGGAAAARLSRFEAERQLSAQMDSDHIAKVFDAGTASDGRPWFAMEYVDGLPITHFCDTYRLELGDRLRLLQQVCIGVQHAHESGVLHKDLKPGNVLVTVKGGRPVAKIIDFGIAGPPEPVRDGSMRDARTGGGTREYMSPEQLAGTVAIDGRSDVFALGVLLFELVTGGLPFGRDGVRGVGAVAPSVAVAAAPELARLAEQRRLLPRALVRQLVGDLDAIASQALAIDRDRRYATPAALHDDLEHHLQQRVVSVRRGALPWLRKAMRRQRLAVVVGFAALLGTTVAGGIWWRQAAQIAIQRGEHVDELLARGREALTAIGEAQGQQSWRLRELHADVDQAVAACESARRFAASEPVDRPRLVIAEALLTEANAWRRDIAEVEALDAVMLQGAFGSKFARDRRRVQQIGDVLRRYGIDLGAASMDRTEAVAAVIAGSRLREYLIVALFQLATGAGQVGDRQLQRRCRDLIAVACTPEQSAFYLQDGLAPVEDKRQVLRALEPQVKSGIEATLVAMAMDGVGLGELADSMFARLDVASPSSYELHLGRFARAWARVRVGIDPTDPGPLRDADTAATFEAMALAALAANPQRRGGWINVLRVLCAAGSSRAVAVGNRALELFPDDPTMLYYTAAALQSSDKPAAQRVLLRLVEVEPGYTRAWVALSQMAADEAAALEFCRRALEHDPYHADLAVRCAEPAIERGDGDAALALLHPAVVADWRVARLHELAATALGERRPYLAALHLQALSQLGDHERGADESAAWLRAGDPARALDVALRDLTAAGGFDHASRRDHLVDQAVAAAAAMGAPRTRADLLAWVGAAPKVQPGLDLPSALMRDVERGAPWPIAALEGDLPRLSLPGRFEQARVLVRAGLALSRADLQLRGWQCAVDAIEALQRAVRGSDVESIAAFLLLDLFAAQEPVRGQFSAKPVDATAPVSPQVLDLRRRCRDDLVALRQQVRPHPHR